MVYKKIVEVNSNDKAVTFHNVTDYVKKAVKDSRVRNGIAVVYSHHTTCSVTTQECAFDMSVTGIETLQQDLLNVFDEIIPPCKHEGIYLHPGKEALKFAAEHGEDARGCHNTDAHLRSSVMGRSESIVIDDGELDLGEFGYIYFIDFDTTRGRKRTVKIMVIGE